MPASGALLRLAAWLLVLSLTPLVAGSAGAGASAASAGREPGTAGQPRPAPAAAGQPAPIEASAPPAALEVVGQVGGTLTGVVAAGPYAYAGIGPRLVIFDVAEPGRPSCGAATTPAPPGAG